MHGGTEGGHRRPGRLRLSQEQPGGGSISLWKRAPKKRKEKVIKQTIRAGTMCRLIHSTILAFALMRISPKRKKLRLFVVSSQ